MKNKISFSFESPFWHVLEWSIKLACVTQSVPQQGSLGMFVNLDRGAHLKIKGLVFQFGHDVNNLIV